MQADPASSTSSMPVAPLRRRACMLWLLGVGGFLAAGMAVLLATDTDSSGWRSQSVTVIAVMICATLVLLWWQLWSLKPAARSRQQLPAEFEQLAALLPDGVLIADGNTVLYANPAASNILGIDAGRGDTATQLLAGLSVHGLRSKNSELPVQLCRMGGEPFHAML
ncbi:MAG: PAS domain-containing protein, partial [Stenotrophomonas sp.]